jgi:SAM-dependent methyltransferase
MTESQRKNAEPHLDPRSRRLLEGLSRSARILEVGGSFRPLAPKSLGYETCSVDHDTRAGLLAKYAGAAIHADLIEEVDVVWREGPLHEAFPTTALGTFDAVVVSHVLEHLPDLIGFLASARRLVRDDGCLVFALPDKRWCFDCFRPVSLAGDVLWAHRERRTRHTPATLFNEVAYSVTLHGRPGWGADEPAADVAFAHRLELARRLFDDSQADDVYRDAHGWQFTPASFELLILDLAQASACDWHVDWIEPQPAVEFLGRLRAGAVACDAGCLPQRRRDLLFAMARESREQLDRLLATEPATKAAA